MVRFTEEAGIVPHFAREEAERRHQHYLGPEHLLLGLLREEKGIAAQVLTDAGLELAATRAETLRQLDAGARPTFHVRIDETSDQSIYEQIVAQV